MEKFLTVLYKLIDYQYFKFKYKIDLYFNGPFIKIHGDGELNHGKNCYVSMYSRVFVDEGTAINLGNNVAIGHNCRIYTSIADVSDFKNNSDKKNQKKGTIEIGNNVTFAANCYVGPNVKICDDVFIGHGSVVTKSIHTPGVYCGNPLECLKTFQ